MLGKIFKKIGKKYRLILLSFLILWTLWFFGLGTISGFFLNKSGLEKFPEIKNEDKILILAPHIDDEMISSSGIIMQAKTKGARIKIVYLTCGDENLGSVIKEDKSLKINPNDFIALGKRRITEGKNAAKILGLTEEELFFLGYPDGGLTPMFSHFYNSAVPFSSLGTKFTFNPYSNTGKIGQTYLGKNVTADLEEIIKEFAPTIIIAPHIRDKHPDHHAAYLFLEKALESISYQNSKIFCYLVHYPLFPSTKKLKENEFLYPPKKLFTKSGWFSFDLSDEQLKKKLQAVSQNVSQKEFPAFYDLLSSFVKKNEIFEEI